MFEPVDVSITQMHMLLVRHKIYDIPLEAFQSLNKSFIQYIVTGDMEIEDMVEFIKFHPMNVNIKCVHVVISASGEIIRNGFPNDRTLLQQDFSSRTFAVLFVVIFVLWKSYMLLGAIVDIVPIIDGFPGSQTPRQIIDVLNTSIPPLVKLFDERIVLKLAITGSNDIRMEKYRKALAMIALFSDTELETQLNTIIDFKPSEYILYPQRIQRTIKELLLIRNRNENCLNAMPMELMFTLFEEIIN
jgi:hypothetical protein